MTVDFERINKQLEEAEISLHDAELVLDFFRQAAERDELVMLDGHNETIEKCRPV